MEAQNYDTDVLVVDDLGVCNERLREELERYPFESVVLGLDCEWVSDKPAEEGPAFPVALLQLAFPNGRCLLIRLCQMRGTLPNELREILENKDILKTGVGISEDAKKLSSCYGLVMQGCVDLRHVASRCRGYVQYSLGYGVRHGMSLSALSQQVLGVTLDKDWKIRCSNWEAPRLSKRQIQYAANDAIVAARIFFMLAAAKLKEKEERFKAGNNGDLENDNTVLVEHTGNDMVENEPEDEDADRIVFTVDCDDLQIEGCAPESEQLVTDFGDDSEKTHSDSQGGILSGLLSKLSDFPLGSVFATQAKTELNSDKSERKSKAYSQYPSFKNLNVSEDSLATSELWSCLGSLCQGIVDIPFKMKTKQKNGKDQGQSNEKTKQRATGVHNKLSAMQPRRAPLYQNCVIEAPDGEMLSTCDKRKANWYLCRGLADVVKEDPYTIRLRFEPSGRPLDPENNYYLTFKENMCVACGRDDSYMRKNIIPHDYRKHFPTCMKDHHSHDVLLLCPPCHMTSTHYDDILRKKLAEKYKAPLGNQASSQVARLVQDPALKQVKSAAKALVYAGGKIPEKRRQELLSIVKEYFNEDSLTHEMMLEASEIETRRENCAFISHGREVVRKVKDEGELLKFERMWREHFLQSMKPKFLPPLWTVDHEQEKVKRLLQQELMEEEDEVCRADN